MLCMDRALSPTPFATTRSSTLGAKRATCVKRYLGVQNYGQRKGEVLTNSTYIYIYIHKTIVINYKLYIVIL